MAPHIYQILNYPERGENEALCQSLEDVGVELMPLGEQEVFGVPVLGKGWSSIVVYGKFNDKEVAVKIQRSDSNRISLQKEASILRIVNSYGIGPTLYWEGEDFLVLEYIEGASIREAVVTKDHARSFLLQCHQLDVLRIDHGQIQGGKHLIIGEKCWIIDFEKAGLRIPRNVTSLISELFLKKTHFARGMKSKWQISENALIQVIRTYKKNFDIDPVLHILHL